MSHDRIGQPSHRQSGFALVSAVFLLVVLVALGAFMVTLSNTQQITSAQDIQGSRALAAARGGIQWAVGTLQYTPPAAATPCFASPSTFTLDGFTVSVTCAARTYTEGSDSKTIYWVESTASAGGAVGSLAYTERLVSTFIEF